MTTEPKPDVVREALYDLQAVAVHCENFRRGEPYFHLIEKARAALSAPDLLADNERLRGALAFCEAQMAYCEIKDERGPCFGQAILQARAALAELEKP